jgi:multiple sugar transport system ATP-binding protein
MDGREVMIGIRPEHLRDIPREGAGALASVRMKIELVETLGHEVLVHGHLGEDLVVAKVDPHQRPEIDTEVELKLELDKLRLFDAATEQHLTRGD